jgi:hypothetical protein
MLHGAYYLLQILVHRPFIPVRGKPAATRIPSVAVCMNAARACARVLQAQLVRESVGHWERIVSVMPSAETNADRGETGRSDEHRFNACAERLDWKALGRCIRHQSRDGRRADLPGRPEAYGIPVRLMPFAAARNPCLFVDGIWRDGCGEDSLPRFFACILRAELVGTYCLNSPPSTAWTYQFFLPSLRTSAPGATMAQRHRRRGYPHRQSPILWCGPS